MRKHRGFTLFEVVIAMTIVVILVGVMSSTITVAFRQKRAAEDAIESVRDTNTVGDFLVQELGNALPPTTASQPATDSSGGIVGAPTGLGSLGGTTGGLGGIETNTQESLIGPFIGDNVSINFYTSGPEHNAPLNADVKYVEYSLGQDSKGVPALVRRVSINLLADQVETILPQETLISHVRQVTFRYYGGPSLGWFDTWDSTQNSDTLPYAVSIELQLDPLNDGGPVRTLKRFASLWCASPPASSTDTSADTGGIIPGF